MTLTTVLSHNKEITHAITRGVEREHRERQLCNANAGKFIY